MRATNTRYSAVVRDNQDPNQQGRLMLEIPELLDDRDPLWPEWIRPRLPAAGPGAAALFWVPPVDAIVLVEVDEVTDPRWFGADFGSVNTLPPDLATNYPARFGLTSPSGAQVLVGDDSDGWRLYAGQEGAQARSVAEVLHGSLLLQHFGGAQVSVDASGVALDGTQILLGPNPTNPYPLTVALLTDLLSVCTDIVAVATAAGAAAPNATVMIQNIVASLVGGSPYLSVRTFGD